MNYPRRQQYRWIKRALAVGTAAFAAAGLAALALSLGAVLVAAVLVVVAAILGARTRYWARLAGRSRVGAHSEDQVQHALAPLEGEGWRMRHSLPWQGHGDIDSVAIAPTGIAFAIETKTRRFDAQHIARVLEMAAWLQNRRRRWCPRGALPVLCVVHSRQLEQVQADVLIVSADRLVPALRTAAGAQRRPAFLGHARSGSR